MAKQSFSEEFQESMFIGDLQTYSQFHCRVCLKHEGVVPIFGDVYKPDISEEVQAFGNIKVKQNDKHPKCICEECYSFLEGAIRFRKRAKQAELFLRQTELKGVKAETDLQGLAVAETHENLCKYESTQKIDFVSVKLDDQIEANSYNETININDNDSVDNGPGNDNDMVMLIVSNKTKDFIKCTYCNINFETSEEYEEHRTTIEHKRNYVISFLPKKTRKKIADEMGNAILPEDKQTVHPKDQKCEVCNRLFTKLHFPRHMRTQHKIKIETTRSATKKECPVCQRMLNPMALTRHMKKIHGDEKDPPPKVKVECPICKKLFSKEFFPLHIQRHKQGDSKNYICDQCGKKFFFKSSFCTHRLIHSNDLPHKCEYCPYRGRTKELLKIHVRTHTGDYPYKCTQCGTRCLTKSNLNSHMRRHRGPIDFICDSCNRGFYTKIQLERHITVSHYGIKNHICSICGAAFGYRHGLMSHQRKVHKRPKGIGKPKAVYLQLEEEGLLQPQQEV